MNRLGLVMVIGMSLAADGRAQWSRQESGTDARLRGVCAVDDRVAWASGAKGTVLRTIDGGKRWERLVIPDASDLDFRDIQAFDARNAFVLAIGPGPLSRIYRTSDGGATWVETHREREQAAFLDAIAFWSPTHGLVQGDPIDGRFLIGLVDQEGRCRRLPDDVPMPVAIAGEGAFAASGTCLVVQGERNAWFATGGGAEARVFRSTDGGRSWSVAATPIAAGTASAGIFSIAFRDADHGVVVGGDYKQTERGGKIVARTTDGGKTWVLPRGNLPASFRSGVVYVPGMTRPTLIAVGPAGTDVSTDDGESWTTLAGPGFNAVSFAGPGAGWAVGENGRIARFAGRLEP